MIVAPLGSGSAGNACYFESDGTSILVDAGLGPRETAKRLEQIGRSLEHLQALVITHEHYDHVRGAESIARKLSIPIYLTKGTLDASAIDTQETPVVVFENNSTFPIGELNIHACRTLHDQTIDPLVMRVRTGKVALTFAPLYGFGSPAPNGQGAAAAALCAGEQNKFWSFHDALYQWQGQFGTQAFTNNRINAGVAAFGLDQGKFSACVASGQSGDVLTAAKSQAEAVLNFNNSAPKVTINGVIPLDDKNQPITDGPGIIARIDLEIARVNALPTERVTPEATAAATAQATSQATAAVTQQATVEVTPAKTIATSAPTTEITPAATPAATAAR